MLQIKDELCIGCSLCAIICPSRAIILVYGKARINPTLCTNCYRCVSICPQGAIQEEARVTISTLKSSLQKLEIRINQLSARLSKLEARRRTL